MFLILSVGLLSGPAPMARAAETTAGSLNEYQSTQKGLREYGNKDYTGAAESFSDAQADDPDAVTHHMNLGDALLKSGSAAAAIPEFKSVMKSKNANLAARGAYNLGRSYEEQKDYENALRSYQEGLDRLATVKNADSEIRLRIKRALEQAQRKKQSKGKGGKSGGKQPKKQDKSKGGQNQRMAMPKPKFKADKLSEKEAKRILQQLEEQEKKTQQNYIRSKTVKPHHDKNMKDW